MKRRLFGLSALFGAISAAQVDHFPSAEGHGSLNAYPRKNNECPVCGAMAEAFKRYTFKEIVGYEHVPGGDETVVRVITKDVPSGPKYQLTRCKRCNGAFWQDAA